MINKNWQYIPAGQGNELKVEAENWSAKFIQQIGLIDGQENKINMPTLTFQDTTQNFDFGLEALVTNRAVLECTTALTTVKIFVLKKLLGDSFSDYVSYFKNQMQVRNWPTEEFYNELPGQFIEHDNPRNATPGYIVYISNVPYYGYFKPNGNGRGSNLIQISNDSYIGFSAIYSDGPQSLSAIAAQDKKLFCLEGDVEKEQKHHQRACDVINQKPERFYEEFLEAQGKNPVMYFSADRINEFLIKKEFDKFWGD